MRNGARCKNTEFNYIPIELVSKPSLNFNVSRQLIQAEPGTPWLLEIATTGIEYSESRRYSHVIFN